jgi:hypothetical protein
MAEYEPDVKGDDARACVAPVIARMAGRNACRAFVRSPTPPLSLVLDIIASARNVPSSQNSQPWYVCMYACTHRCVHVDTDVDLPCKHPAGSCTHVVCAC